MGVASSSEVPNHFEDITRWPKTRVEAAIKAYMEGEYDFGIDYNVVMNITGYEPDEAKELVRAHSRNDSGIINAITLLISIISLGNSENRNEVGRLESIFDLMDFNHNSQISMDELTILLLCIATSFSYILNKTESNEDESNDNATISFAKHIYDSLNKRPSQFITKDEFSGWAKENLFSQGANTINDVLYRITTEPESNIDGKADAEGEH